MSGLVTKIVLNATISEAENKIPDTNNLVNTAVLNTKIREVEKKFLINFTTINFI